MPTSALKTIGTPENGNFGRFYRIRAQWLYFDESGREQILRLTCDYAILGQLSAPVSKQGLVQSGWFAVGGTKYCGFLPQVYIPITQVLSQYAQPYGIFVKDRLNIDDHDDQLSPWQPNIVPPTAAGRNVIPAQFQWPVGTNLSWTTASMFPSLPAGSPAGVVGTTSSVMPPDVTVTILKYTGLSGRNWSHGRWTISPTDQSFWANDELSALGQAMFATDALGPVGGGGTTLGLLQCLYQPIGDGQGNVLQPIMVSQELSQLRRLPTRISFNPITLTGAYNYLLSQGPALINLEAGTQRRRKTKPMRTDRSDLRFG
jgi:hypothetical protein